jgi:hypothetical protein
MRIPGRPGNVGESRAEVAIHPEWQSRSRRWIYGLLSPEIPLSCSWKLDSSFLFYTESIYINIGIFRMRERRRTIIWF